MSKENLLKDIEQQAEKAQRSLVEGPIPKNIVGEILSNHGKSIRLQERALASGHTIEKEVRKARIRGSLRGRQNRN